MNCRAYVAVSGTLFGIVAALHLLRVVNEWAVEVGPWSAPMSVSWIGSVIPAILCVWAFWLVRRDRA